MGGYQSVRRSMQEGSEDYRFEKDVGPLARTMLRSFVRCADLARLRLRHPSGIPRSSLATIFWDENRWLSVMQEIFRNHDHSIRGAVKKPVLLRTGTLLSDRSKAWIRCVERTCSTSGRATTEATLGSTAWTTGRVQRSCAGAKRCCVARQYANQKFQRPLRWGWNEGARSCKRVVALLSFNWLLLLYCCCCCLYSACY